MKFYLYQDTAVQYFEFKGIYYKYICTNRLLRKPKFCCLIFSKNLFVNNKFAFTKIHTRCLMKILICNCLILSQQV